MSISTDSKPFLLKHLDGRFTRVQRVDGIKAFYDWEGDNTHAAVDAGIAPIIDLLNRKGYKTWVSCSGLPEDHPDQPNAFRHAYIGYKCEDFDTMESILIEAGFKNIENDSACVQANNVDELRTVWNKLYELVMEL